VRRLAILLVLTEACGDNDAVQKLYVDPAGDDAASGAPHAPLRSLQGARDALRRMRAAGELAGPIDVLFADGMYPMTAPVAFTPEDSGTASGPVRFVGDGAVLSGGIVLHGFEVEPDGTWRAVVPSQFSQLWVGDRRAIRAREPDGAYGAVLRVDEEPLGELDASGRWTYARQTVHIEPSALANVEPGTVFTAVHRWDITRKPIESVDPVAGTLTILGRGMKPWNRIDHESVYVLESYASALDVAGEWFLTPDGMLRYKPRPGEHPATTEVIAPVAEQLVVIRGDIGQPVEHLAFEGLTFAHTDWAMPPEGVEPLQTAWYVGGMIEVDHARFITFEDCEVAHVGRYAIWMRDGVRDSTIRGCDLHDLGAGGIRIGDRELPTDNTRTSEITVDNNLIHEGGRVLPSAVGIWIAQSPRNTITHNLVVDFYYTAISFGWTWGDGPTDTADTTIAHNRIAFLGNQLMSDLGGIYTLGSSPNTVIHGNRIHDIAARSFGGWGLYNDEGSAGFTMTDNLVYRVSGSPYHLHYGRNNVLANNILGFGGEHQLRITRADAGHALTATRNILVWDRGVLFHGPLLEAGIDFQHNIYWNPIGAIDFLGHDLASWNALGQDFGSVVADPGLRDAAADDFRLDAGSVATEHGFVPFEVGKAGLYGSDAWRAKGEAALSAAAAN
jgi:hypothetical protein